MASDKEEVGANGLPVLPPNKKGAYTFAIVIPVVTSGIGFGMAFGLLKFGDTGSFTNKLRTLQSNDLQWLYASAFLFSKLVQVLNNIPMKFKDEVLTMKSKNLRANMIFYKSLTKKGKDEPLIGMEDEGSVGRYNRANRSLHHFCESSLGFVISFGFAAFVFPKQSFALMGTFCVGRVMHQIGYTTGYGSHGIGFALAALSSAAVDGILLLVVGKAFDVI